MAKVQERNVASGYSFFFLWEFLSKEGDTNIFGSKGWDWGQLLCSLSPGFGGRCLDLWLEGKKFNFSATAITQLEAVFVLLLGLTGHPAVPAATTEFLT